MISVLPPAEELGEIVHEARSLSGKLLHKSIYHSDYRLQYACRLARFSVISVLMANAYGGCSTASFDFNEHQYGGDTDAIVKYVHEALAQAGYSVEMNTYDDGGAKHTVLTVSWKETNSNKG